mmetsp:Transcript_21805/g.66195  ORF Transcript_21805/g.66195 Transcript_21805/m.66195 type:complete len:221 (-) Transcript_21805:279-941(-)
MAIIRGFVVTGRARVILIIVPLPTATGPAPRRAFRLSWRARLRILALHLHQALRRLDLIANKFCIVHINSLQILCRLALLHQHLLPTLSDRRLVLQNIYQGIHRLRAAQRLHAHGVAWGSGGAPVRGVALTHHEKVVICGPCVRKLLTWSAGPAPRDAHASRRAAARAPRNLLLSFLHARDIGWRARLSWHLERAHVSLIADGPSVLFEQLVQGPALFIW